MHTYFGTISSEEFNEFDLDHSDVFVDKNGQAYWYKAEITENDEFLICDTVGRMVPIPMSALEDLLEILESVVTYMDRVEAAEHNLKNTFNDC